MAAFRDMEEVSQGLLSLLGANRAEAQQRRLLGRHEQVVERLLETQDSVEQRLQGQGWGRGRPGPGRLCDGRERPVRLDETLPPRRPHPCPVLPWALPALGLSFPHP